MSKTGYERRRAGYQRCVDTGLKGVAMFAPFFGGLVNGKLVYVDKSLLAEVLQQTTGDLMLNNTAGEMVCLEVKAEAADKWGHFYLEVDSNYCIEDPRWNKPGWMVTSQCDWLVYAFLKQQTAYCIRFPDLKTWAYDTPGQRGIMGRMYNFERKDQWQTEQLNLARGYCVPIEVIGDEVGFIKIQRSGDVFTLCPVKKPFSDGIVKAPHFLPPELVPRKPRQGEMFSQRGEVFF